MRWMHWLVGILLFLGTIAAMEGVAYAAHRWIMHGPGWFLHASHHRPRHGRFEANDLYAVIFAAPSIALIYMGVHGGWGVWAAWVGAGIAAYGAIYFIFHDVIVHRRVPHGYKGRSRYMKRIIQGHRLHHAVETKHDSIGFGFLWSPDPRRMKSELASRKQGMRGPAARQPR